MRSEPTIDVSTLDFQQWLELVFDHPDAEPAAKSRYWNGPEFSVTKPARLVEHLTGLCHGFAENTSRYTLRQIDQGIWFVLCVPIEAGKYLLDSSVPLPLRLECIHSMFSIYADFVSKSEVEVMENCFDMWWDLICGDVWSAIRESEFVQRPRSPR